MNKKYIDFVPTRSDEMASSVKRSPVRRAVNREVVYRDTEVLVDDTGIGVMEETFSIQQEPSLGVVEDFRPKFVKTEVPKRPLGQGHFEQRKSDVVEAKSKKIKVKSTMREPSQAAKPAARRRVQTKTQPSVQPEVQTKTKAPAKAQGAYRVPKSPFINQEKVAKRPLSKNVYQKSVKPTKQNASGPVTIITKPKKDAHASMIVTIILTIIVGAAAGTIAFLLLPK